jgi:hypothetical protein
MTYKKLHDIRACVTTSWTHKNCKFQRGDFAQVSTNVLPREYITTNRNGFSTIRPGRATISRRKQARAGQVGRVLAASCVNDGSRRMRNNDPATGTAIRQHTRYYMQFTDGEIMGFDSHLLSKAFNIQA